MYLVNISRQWEIGMRYNPKYYKYYFMYGVFYYALHRLRLLVIWSQIVLLILYQSSSGFGYHNNISNHLWVRPTIPRFRTENLMLKRTRKLNPKIIRIVFVLKKKCIITFTLYTNYVFWKDSNIFLSSSTLETKQILKCLDM